MTRYLKPIMSRSWLAASAALLVLLAGCGGQSAPKLASTLKELKVETLKPGMGSRAAEDGDMLLVSYKGTLANGTQFDQNVGSQMAPMSVVLGQGAVIKGWEEGLKGMKVGETRKISVPPSMGYGEAGQPPAIPPNADLFFEATLLGMVKKSDPGGYEFEDVKAGAGPEVKAGDKVEVHYKATYVNEKLVDDTRKRGSTVKFTVGGTGSPRPLAGISDGVVGMRAGGRRKLWLPPALMYGTFGSQFVNGNQIVVFDIELIRVN